MRLSRMAGYATVVTGCMAVAPGRADPGKLLAFSGVRKFPSRVKCATLAWHAARTATRNGCDKTATE